MPAPDHRSWVDGEPGSTSGSIAEPARSRSGHGRPDVRDVRAPVAPIVVAVTGAPGSAALVRRAARLAEQDDAKLIGVHVRGHTRASDDRDLASLRDVLLAVGGEYREVVGDDVASGLLSVVDEAGANRLLLGEADSSVWQQLRDGSIVGDVLERATGLDVLVLGPGAILSRRTAPSGPRASSRSPILLPNRSRRSPLTARRRGAGYLMAIVGVPMVTAASFALGSEGSIDSPAALLFLALTTAVAIVGGRRPALVSAVASALATTYFFTPPQYTFAFATPADFAEVVVLVSLAIAVGTIVSRLAEREESARQSEADTELLARVAGGLPEDHSEFEDLLDAVRERFALDAVAVLHAEPGDEWSNVAASGSPAPARPEDGLAIPLDASAVLVARGGPLEPDRQRLLFALSQQMTSALERQRLADAAAQAAVAVETERLRTAILRAVSHDFRTPLSSIKASATSLLADDVEWPAEARRRFLHTIDEQTDHLNRMVMNLLDLSRLEAGGVERHIQSTSLEDVFPHVVRGLDAATTSRLEYRDPGDGMDGSPRLLADPVLLERVLTNIVGNALEHTDRPVEVDIRTQDDRVLVRVTDHGHGIPAEQREQVLQPFHRLGDATPGGRGARGAGLGLAVAKGFVETMGGELALDDTYGGGLTVTVDLPAVPDPIRTADQQAH